jgi:hypothetical protein
VPGGLDDINIQPAYTFLDFSENFAIRKPTDLGSGHLFAKVIANAFCQGDVGRACKNFKVPFWPEHKPGMLSNARSNFKGL